jgi:hypothetical protein
MKPKAIIAIGLISTLAAGPALAQTPQTAPQTAQGAQSPPPAVQAPQSQSPQAQSQSQSPQPTSSPSQSLRRENLDKIRDAVGREPTLRIENGQLRIYAEVIGRWPTFADATAGYDFMNGPTRGNPMSHAEFVAMSTPKELNSSSGITAGETLVMGAVGAVGQWAIVKALNKIGTSRKEKQLRDIRAQIDADLAAIKKDR